MAAICYGLYFLLEQIDNKQSGDLLEKAKRTLADTEVGLLRELAGLCRNYSVVAPIISDAIIRPISEVLGKPIKMHHRHDDLIEEKEDLVEPEPSNCSIVQLLLRYHGLFSEEQYTEAVEPFIVSLFASYEFKTYFAVQFIRYLRFMTLKTGEDSWKWSQMAGLQYQTLSSDQLGFVAFTNNNVHDFIRSVLKLASKPFFPVTLDNQDWRFQVFFLQCTLMGWLKTRRVRISWASDSFLLDGYLEVFKLVQTNRYEFTSAVVHGGLDDQFYTQILGACGSVSFFCERALEMTLTVAFASLSSKVVEDTFVAALLRQLPKHVLGMCSERLKSEYREDALAVDYTMERIFVYFFAINTVFEKSDGKLRMSSWNQERALTLSEEVIGEQHTKLWRCLLAKFSRAVGFMREVTRGLWVNLV